MGEGEGTESRLTGKPEPLFIHLPHFLTRTPMTVGEGRVHRKPERGAGDAFVTLGSPRQWLQPETRVFGEATEAWAQRLPRAWGSSKALCLNLNM